MLCELFIENLAVIEKAGVEFGPGFNVLTGETGAGKSIMIDAINAVLGQRTSKEIVRHGTDRASVTARFCHIPKKLADVIRESGYPLEEDELILTREIRAGEGGSARLNGRPISISLLREFGASLINIHGQHDNQVLLSPERHIDILDQYGDFAPLLEEYSACYHEVVRIKRELKKASMSEQEKARRLDLLTYQVKEIDDAALEIGEEEELEKRRSEIRAAERIMEDLQDAFAALYGNEGEGGAVELAKSAAQSLSRAADAYESAGDLYARVDGVAAELEAAADAVESMMESFDYSPEALRQAEDRLDEIRTLKRKYGNSIEEILAYGESARAELEEIGLSDQRVRELNEVGNREYTRLLGLADQVTAARKQAADRFVQSVTEELSFLDMPNVRLEVACEPVKPGPKGRDAVEFRISTNRGEPPKPIAKIASGGELSRIMLAIKNTLAERDEIPTLIFDEVDTGVSGHAAQKIGQKLKQAAKTRQVFAVTHLAQIAALADAHYLIRKQSDESRTYTSVDRLEEEAHIEEVARIMSTDAITDLMRQTAREMVEKGKNA